VFGVAQHKWISQQYDDRHLRQPRQGTRPYLEILSRLLIQVLVMIFGKIVNPTSKESDDPISGTRRYVRTSRGRATISGRFSDPFGRFFTFYNGQFNPLFISKSHFGERLKNSVFVKSLDGFCHVSKSIEQACCCQIRHHGDNVSNNLNTAKQIGLTIPQRVLGRADRVIR
jgi:hypothetical protein